MRASRQSAGTQPSSSEGWYIKLSTGDNSSALKIKVGIPPGPADLNGRRSLSRVKPGFIRQQGSSDRSFYASFTALLTDTCSERSYPFVFATNLLSDTGLQICIAPVIALCSHWIKVSSEKNTPCFKGIFTKWRRKKTSRFVTGLLYPPVQGVFTLNLWLKLIFYMKEILN